jgi:hypothetical protein
VVSHTEPEYPTVGMVWFDAFTAGDAKPSDPGSVTLTPAQRLRDDLLNCLH